MEANQSTSNISQVIAGVSGGGPQRAVQHDLAIAIGALGIILNAMSIVIFAGRRSGRKLMADIPRRIILHQCFVDLVSGVFLIHAQFHSYYVGVVLPRGLPSPAAYCHVIWSTALLWIILSVSSWNIELLAVERYMSVCHPVTHKNRCTRRTLLALLAVLWAASAGWMSLYMATAMRYLSAANACIYAPPPNSIVQRIYGTGFITHSYFLPVLVLVFTYGRMFLVLKKRAQPSSAGEDESKKTRSFVKTCASIALAYLVCYTLNETYYFLGSIQVINLNPDSAYYHFTVIMVFINCFINPIIFFARMPGFRLELKKLAMCDKGSSTFQTHQSHSHKTISVAPA